MSSVCRLRAFLNLERNQPKQQIPNRHLSRTNSLFAKTTRSGCRHQFNTACRLNSCSIKSNFGNQTCSPTKSSISLSKRLLGKARGALTIDSDGAVEPISEVSNSEQAKVPYSLPDDAEITLAIHCPASHIQRLAYYLTWSQAVQAVPGGCQVVCAVMPPRENNDTPKGQRFTERLLLLSTPSPQAVASVIRADTCMLAWMFPRVYVLQDANRHPDLQTCVQSLMAMLGHLPQGDAKNGKTEEEDETRPPPSGALRLQTFPPAIVRSESLTSAFQPFPTAKLSPSKYQVVGSIVQVGASAFLCGHQSVDLFPLRTGHEEEASTVSRAYFKLREAFERTKDILGDQYQSRNEICLSGRVALDAGSAPGGWTQYLCDMHCSKVYAVDPADMDVLPPSSEHLRLMIQDAIPHLKAQGTELDIFVSDMCLHEAKDLVAIFESVYASGLLKPGSVVVLTFKSVPGYGTTSYEAIVNRHASEIAKKCSRSRVLHLISNRERERTFVGVVA